MLFLAGRIKKEEQKRKETGHYKSRRNNMEPANHQQVHHRKKEEEENKNQHILLYIFFCLVVVVLLVNSQQEFSLFFMTFAVSIVYKKPMRCYRRSGHVVASGGFRSLLTPLSNGYIACKKSTFWTSSPFSLFSDCDIPWLSLSLSPWLVRPFAHSSIPLAHLLFNLYTLLSLSLSLLHL